MFLGPWVARSAGAGRHYSLPSQRGGKIDRYIYEITARVVVVVVVFGHINHHHPYYYVPR
jgi:hypothetical protein